MRVQSRDDPYRNTYSYNDEHVLAHFHQYAHSHINSDPYADPFIHSDILSNGNAYSYTYSGDTDIDTDRHPDAKPYVYSPDDYSDPDFHQHDYLYANYSDAYGSALCHTDIHSHPGGRKLHCHADFGSLKSNVDASDTSSGANASRS